MSSLLDARGLEFPGRLQRADLTLEAGTLTALIGPNGGGKTSLLRALARIDRPRGAVWIGGEDLDRATPARRRRLLSYLPTARDVAWPISGRDLIALGLEEPDCQRIAEVITALELEPLADRPADRLSTGERARVLLARALAPQPKLLLLDEPLSNLDPYWVLRILTLLRDCASDGAAVLVALHDLALLDAFDEVLLLSDGRVQAREKPQAILHHPALEQAFRVRRNQGRWAISPSAGPQSSR